MNIYQQAILEHYHHPQNAGKPTEFTHSASSSNLSCGDECSVYLTIANKQVKQVGHVSEGCSICIASASILSEHIQDMSIAQVAKIDLAQLTQLLGIELTPNRAKCALLCLEAIHKAILETNSK